MGNREEAAPQPPASDFTFDPEGQGAVARHIMQKFYILPYLIKYIGFVNAITSFSPFFTSNRRKSALNSSSINRSSYVPEFTKSVCIMFFPAYRMIASFPLRLSIWIVSSTRPFTT